MDTVRTLFSGITRGPLRGVPVDRDQILEDWGESVTKEQVLQVTAEDLQRIRLDQYQSRSIGCFRDYEVDYMRDLFFTAAKSRSDPLKWDEPDVLGWNVEIFESHLSKQVQLDNIELLPTCSKILFICSLNFASYPFQANDCNYLTYDGYVRAMAYLVRGPEEVFRKWSLLNYYDSTNEDSLKTIQDLEMKWSNEIVFRCLATKHESPMPDIGSEPGPAEPDRDILRLLELVQPLQYPKLEGIRASSLTQTAIRLSPTRIGLDCYQIEKEKLLALLSYLLEIITAVLNQRFHYDSADARLGANLKELRMNISNIDASDISFQDIGSEAFSYLRTALSMLFNTFIQGKGLGAYVRGCWVARERKFGLGL